MITPLNKLLFADNCDDSPARSSGKTKKKQKKKQPYKKGCGKAQKLVKVAAKRDAKIARQRKELSRLRGR